MEKKVFMNGVHDISNTEYHSSEGVSRSALMRLQRSPYHYWHEHLSGLKERTAPTEAMIAGELVHTLVLEEELFSERFAVMAKSDGRTKEGKAYREQFAMDSEGKAVIDADSYSHALGLATAVKESSVCAKLIDGCLIEKSIYFTHEETGIQLKCRPDAWKNTYVIDLKTTADASLRAFQSSTMKYGYLAQASFIKKALKSMGISLEKFVFIAVEKTEPFAVGIYILDEDALSYGDRQVDSLMQTLSRCLDSKEWPSYPPEMLTLPKWATYEDIE